MRDNVYGCDDQYVGAIEGRSFLDRRGQRVGKVEGANVYGLDGAFICSVRSADPQPNARDRLTSAEFARLLTGAQAS